MFAENSCDDGGHVEIPIKVVFCPKCCTYFFVEENGDRTEMSGIISPEFCAE